MAGDATGLRGAMDRAVDRVPAPAGAAARGPNLATPWQAVRVAELGEGLHGVWFRDGGLAEVRIEIGRNPGGARFRVEFPELRFDDGGPGRPAGPVRVVVDERVGAGNPATRPAEVAVGLRQALNVVDSWLKGPPDGTAVAVETVRGPQSRTGGALPEQLRNATDTSVPPGRGAPGLPDGLPDQGPDPITGRPPAPGTRVPPRIIPVEVEGAPPRDGLSTPEVTRDAFNRYIDDILGNVQPDSPVRLTLEKHGLVAHFPDGHSVWFTPQVNSILAGGHPAIVRPEMVWTGERWVQTGPAVVAVPASGLHQLPAAWRALHDSVHDLIPPSKATPDGPVRTPDSPVETPPKPADPVVPVRPAEQVPVVGAEQVRVRDTTPAGSPPPREITPEWVGARLADRSTPPELARQIQDHLTDGGTPKSKAEIDAAMQRLREEAEAAVELERADRPPRVSEHYGTRYRTGEQLTDNVRELVDQAKARLERTFEPSPRLTERLEALDAVRAQADRLDALLQEARATGDLAPVRDGVRELSRQVREYGDRHTIVEHDQHQRRPEVDEAWRDLHGVDPLDAVEMVNRQTAIDPVTHRFHPMDRAIIGAAVERVMPRDVADAVIGQLDRAVPLHEVHARELLSAREYRNIEHHVQGNVKGLYDGRLERLLIRPDRSLMEVASTAVHETTHARQPSWSREVAAFRQEIADPYAQDVAIAQRLFQREYAAFQQQRQFLEGMAGSRTAAQLARDGHDAAVPRDYQWLLESDSRVRQHIINEYVRALPNGKQLASDAFGDGAELERGPADGGSRPLHAWPDVASGYRETPLSAAEQARARVAAGPDPVVPGRSALFDGDGRRLDTRALAPDGVALWGMGTDGTFLVVGPDRSPGSLGMPLAGYGKIAVVDGVVQFLSGERIAPGYLHQVTDVLGRAGIDLSFKVAQPRVEPVRLDGAARQAVEDVVDLYAARVDAAVPGSRVEALPDGQVRVTVPGRAPVVADLSGVAQSLAGRLHPEQLRTALTEWLDTSVADGLDRAAPVDRLAGGARGPEQIPAIADSVQRGLPADARWSVSAGADHVVVQPEKGRPIVFRTAAEPVPRAGELPAAEPSTPVRTAATVAGKPAVEVVVPESVLHDPARLDRFTARALEAHAVDVAGTRSKVSGFVNRLLGQDSEQAGALRPEGRAFKLNGDDRQLLAQLKVLSEALEQAPPGQRGVIGREILELDRQMFKRPGQSGAYVQYNLAEDALPGIHETIEGVRRTYGTQHLEPPAFVPGTRPGPELAGLPDLPRSPELTGALIEAADGGRTWVSTPPPEVVARAGRFDSHAVDALTGHVRGLLQAAADPAYWTDGRPPRIELRAPDGIELQLARRLEHVREPVDTALFTDAAGNPVPVPRVEVTGPRTHDSLPAMRLAEEIRLQDARDRVSYFDAQTRASMEIHLRDGLWYDAEGVPLDGLYHFVVEPGTLRTYALHESQMGRLNAKHASFLAGGDTLSAGEFVAVNGRQVSVSGRSGHYVPTVDHAWMLAEKAREGGADVSMFDVESGASDSSRYSRLRGEQAFTAAVGEIARPGEIPGVARVDRVTTSPAARQDALGVPGAVLRVTTTRGVTFDVDVSNVHNLLSTKRPAGEDALSFDSDRQVFTGDDQLAWLGADLLRARIELGMAETAGPPLPTRDTGGSAAPARVEPLLPELRQLVGELLDGRMPPERATAAVTAVRAVGEGQIDRAAAAAGADGTPLKAMRAEVLARYPAVVDPLVAARLQAEGPSLLAAARSPEQLYDMLREESTRIGRSSPSGVSGLTVPEAARVVDGLDATAGAPGRGHAGSQVDAWLETPQGRAYHEARTALDVTTQVPWREPADSARFGPPEQAQRPAAGLPEPIRAALERYPTTAGRNVDTYIGHDGRIGTRDERADALRIRAAMRPAGADLLLHAAVSPAALGLPDVTGLAGMVGATVTHKGFLPASAHTPQQFERIRLVIEAPAQTRLTGIGELTDGPADAGVLLAAGTRLRLLGIEQTGVDVFTVRARVVGQHDPAALATPLLGHDRIDWADTPGDRPPQRPVTATVVHGTRSEADRLPGPDPARVAGSFWERVQPTGLHRLSDSVVREVRPVQVHTGPDGTVVAADVEVHRWTGEPLRMRVTAGDVGDLRARTEVAEGAPAREPDATVVLSDRHADSPDLLGTFTHETWEVDARLNRRGWWGPAGADPRPDVLTDRQGAPAGDRLSDHDRGGVGDVQERVGRIVAEQSPAERAALIADLRAHLRHLGLDGPNAPALWRMIDAEVPAERLSPAQQQLYLNLREPGWEHIAALQPPPSTVERGAPPPPEPGPTLKDRLLGRTPLTGPERAVLSELTTELHGRAADAAADARIGQLLDRLGPGSAARVVDRLPADLAAAAREVADPGAPWRAEAAQRRHAEVQAAVNGALPELTAAGLVDHARPHPGGDAVIEVRTAGGETVTLPVHEPFAALTDRAAGPAGEPLRVRAAADLAAHVVTALGDRLGVLWAGDADLAAARVLTRGHDAAPAELREVWRTALLDRLSTLDATQLDALRGEPLPDGVAGPLHGLLAEAILAETWPLLVGPDPAALAAGVAPGPAAGSLHLTGHDGQVRQLPAEDVAALRDWLRSRLTDGADAALLRAEAAAILGAETDVYGRGGRTRAEGTLTALSRLPDTVAEQARAVAERVVADNPADAWRREVLPPAAQELAGHARDAVQAARAAGRTGDGADAYAPLRTGQVAEQVRVAAGAPTAETVTELTGTLDRAAKALDERVTARIEAALKAEETATAKAADRDAEQDRTDRSSDARAERAGVEARQAADVAARHYAAAERFWAARDAATAARDAFELVRLELAEPDPARLRGYVDAATAAFETYRQAVAATQPLHEVLTAGVPGGRMPHLDAVTDTVNALLDAADVDVALRPDEADRILQSVWRQAGGEDGAVFPVGMGAAEVRVRFHPGDAVEVPRPPTRSSEVITGHMPQATAGRTLGAALNRNAGPAVAFPVAAALDAAIADGAPGALGVVKEIARHATLNVGGELRRQFSVQGSGNDFSLTGAVADNRGESALFDVDGHWTVQVRPGRPGAVWTDPVPVGDRATGPATGPATGLQLWVPHPYTEPALPQTATDTLPAGRPRAEQFPEHVVTGLTGLERLNDTVVGMLPEQYRHVGGPIRQQVRTFVVEELPGLLADAINDPAGVQRPITDGGRVVATVTVHTRVVPGSAELIGTASDKYHQERLRIAFSGASGSVTIGGSRQADLTAGPRTDAGELPFGTTGLQGTVSTGSSARDGISAGGTAIHPSVQRYSGHTQGYRLSVVHDVTVEPSGWEPSRPDMLTRSVESTGLFRMPEPEAYRYGLPVDKAAVEHRPDGSVVLRDDPETGAPPNRAGRLPDWIGRHGMDGAGPALVQRLTGADALRLDVAEKLAQDNLLPRPDADGNPRLSGDPLRRAAEQANLRALTEISAARLEAAYDQAAQDGILINLVRQRPGLAPDHITLRLRIKQDWDRAELVGHTTAETVVNLDIGSSTFARTGGRTSTLAVRGEGVADLTPGDGVVVPGGAGLGGARTVTGSAGWRTGDTVNQVTLVEGGRTAIFTVPHVLEVVRVDAHGGGASSRRGTARRGCCSPPTCCPAPVRRSCRPRRGPDPRPRRRR
ncbi:hypothetical protein [Dactylosporangium cerinum]